MTSCAGRRTYTYYGVTNILFVAFLYLKTRTIKEGGDIMSVFTLKSKSKLIPVWKKIILKFKVFNLAGLVSISSIYNIISPVSLNTTLWVCILSYIGIYKSYTNYRSHIFICGSFCFKKNRKKVKKWKIIINKN